MSAFGCEAGITRRVVKHTVCQFRRYSAQSAAGAGTQSDVDRGGGRIESCMQRTSNRRRLRLLLHALLYFLGMLSWTVWTSIRNVGVMTSLTASARYVRLSLSFDPSLFYEAVVVPRSKDASWYATKSTVLISLWDESIARVFCSARGLVLAFHKGARKVLVRSDHN